jgi:cytosine/adenosine deaminase-related metal-dependent hydrolase
MIQPLRKVRTTNDELRQLQSAVEATLGGIVRRDILDGQVVRSVRLTAGAPVAVEHGLGRQVTGWIVVGRDADAVVWDDQAVNPTPARTLRLVASADVTVSLWVF